MTRLVVGLAVAWAANAAACRGRASADDCREMADRYIEVSLREAPNANALSPAQTEAIREVERGLKRAVPAYRKVLDHCDQVTTAEASCATSARTAKDWEACVHPSDAGR